MRPKLFLTLALLSVAPLLLISAVTSFISLRHARDAVRRDLADQLDAGKLEFERLLNQYRLELRTAAHSQTLVEFARAHENSNGPTDADTQQLRSLQEPLAPILLNRESLSSIACFNRDRHFLFSAQKSGGTNLKIDTYSARQFPETETRSNNTEELCKVASAAATGKILRCATPITSEQTGEVGLLQSDVKLDALFTEIARRLRPASPNVFVMLEQSGEILYHNNEALRHQMVSNVLPEFQPIAQSMTSGVGGEGFYRTAAGDDWYAAYAPLSQPGLSIAAAKNYSIATRAARRTAWLSFGLATLFGLGTATTLVLLYRRRSRSLERVTKGVHAIAGGDLDLQIETRSRDDMGDLARGVNVVASRLREQVARETEMRQIDSFVRVAAMLTHDLKNAINGLSMYVANMEQQFEDPAFRAESVAALTDATQKLQSLVDRLSNPVTTLSGEYKRPQPTDLVPLLRDVLKRVVGPNARMHRIDVQLPERLVALIDGERIQTVFENLILNAVESMSQEAGTLTLTGARDDSGKIVITVTDTGVGMTDGFIEQKLFHAFATTKKKGMGLGLYTCREVVTANGGSINVTSKVGVGTTFSVVLPSPPSNKTES